MKQKISILIFALFLMLSFGSVEQVLACICGKQPICVEFGEADAVFVGKVINSKKQKITNRNGIKEIWDVGEITFQVVEAFHGVKRDSRVTVVSGTGNGSCDSKFERGKTYLVYGYKNNKAQFKTSICSRTQLISDADKDLEYLRNLPLKNSGAKIYGEVDEVVKNPNENTFRQYNPLPGIALTIQNTELPKLVFFAETNAQGHYEFDRIPEGKYKIVPKIPNYYKIDKDSTEEFEVSGQGCVQKNFSVENDSKISGTLIDSEGKPVKNIKLELILEGQKNIVNGSDEEYTNEDGEFNFSEIPVGNYLLAINYINTPDASSPFPTTFYPYASKKSSATAIRIGLGEKIENIVFRLPPRLIENNVYGTVLWEDGTPAKEVNVLLEDMESLDTYINARSFKTDNQGNFVLKSYIGRKYRLRVRGERKIKEKMQELFAEAPEFVADVNVPKFKLILNLVNDPIKEKN